jgi:hypothetical protein
MQYIDLKRVNTKSRQSGTVASAVLLPSQQKVRLTGQASYPSPHYTKAKHTPIRRRKVMSLNSTIRKGRPVFCYIVFKLQLSPERTLIKRITIN